MVTFCSVKYVTTVNCSRRPALRENLIPPFRRCGLPYKNCTGIASASARFLVDQLRKLVFERGELNVNPRIIVVNIDQQQTLTIPE